MQGLTHESVNAVLKKRLDPKTIGVIVAGDFAKAARRLQKLRRWKRNRRSEIVLSPCH